MSEKLPIKTTHDGNIIINYPFGYLLLEQERTINGDFDFSLLFKKREAMKITGTSIMSGIDFEQIVRLETKSAIDNTIKQLELLRDNL